MAARVDPQRSAIAPVPPDAEGCADGRQRFLTADVPEPGQVRPAILASWRRSRAAGLAADRLQVPFLRDPDAETPLTRSAGPVLSRLSERLSGLAVSIILTDPAGTVLSRRTLDHDFERQLDRVLLAPGFSYAERFAGTNGIGTALETGAATQVFGHEHYAENLERLACAAAPIHDPVSGRMAGVLDLTCWRKDTDALLLTLAETTAEQIQQAMLMAAGRAEAAVLQAYRQACRRTAGIVLAVTADAVTLNDRARAELAPGDQAAVVAHAVEIGRALAPGHRRHVDVPLPIGVAARLHCHQVDDAGRAAGLVVHVRLGEQGALAPSHEARQPAPSPAARPGGRVTAVAPGLRAGLRPRRCRGVGGAAAVNPAPASGRSRSRWRSRWRTGSGTAAGRRCSTATTPVATPPGWPGSGARWTTPTVSSSPTSTR